MVNVDRSQLIADLESLQAGLTREAYIEQSDCIVLNSAEKVVYTFNEEIACFVPIDLGVTGAVIAEPFLKVLSKISDAVVSIEQSGDELVVRGAKAEAGIKCENRLVLPIDVLERADSAEWKPLPEYFRDAVVLVENCVSTVKSDFYLSSIHITPSFFESANLNQMCRFKLDFDVKEPFLIRCGNLKKIVKTGVSEYAETPNWLHFRNAYGLTIACRKHNEKYNVSTDKLINASHEGVDIVLPKNLNEAVDSATIFSRENTDGSDEICVEFDSENKQISLTGEGLYGWFKYKYPIVYDGVSVSFRVKPELFKDLLGKYDSCRVCDKYMLVLDDRLIYLTEVIRD
jgi:hypothetical protein